MSKPDRLKEIDRIVETMASAPSTAWPELKVIRDEPITSAVSIAIPYAPPLVRAPSTTAETIRLAYETVAKRHEEAAEQCRETADRQIENHLSLAKIIREQGEQSAQAAGKACDVAAKYGADLDALRKGLTEGAADAK